MTCIRFHSDFFQRDITSEMEITRTRKKNVCQLFFHEESIYIYKHARFVRYAMHVSNRWTDAQPETNMPRRLLRSWGHNEEFAQNFYGRWSITQQTFLKFSSVKISAMRQQLKLVFIFLITCISL